MPGHISSRRVAETVAFVALAVAIAVSDPVHGGLRAVLAWAEPALAGHPVLGPLLFVALSALSAMFAFVSSAVLVPAAVFAWGPALTVLWLWISWLVGGAASWWIGAHLGRAVVVRFVAAERLDAFLSPLRGGANFPIVLLFQLAVPSEVPGYVLGLLGYPLGRYLLALAIAELPFALGAVWLGGSLLDRSPLTLIALGGVGALASAVAMRRFRARLRG